MTISSLYRLCQCAIVAEARVATKTEDDGRNHSYVLAVEHRERGCEPAPSIQGSVMTPAVAQDLMAAARTLTSDWNRALWSFS